MTRSPLAKPLESSLPTTCKLQESSPAQLIHTANKSYSKESQSKIFFHPDSRHSNFFEPNSSHMIFKSLLQTLFLKYLFIFESKIIIETFFNFKIRFLCPSIFQTFVFYYLVLAYYQSFFANKMKNKMYLIFSCYLYFLISYYS